jgi:serine phosphatase RsbU (regulator of sigma subunit)
MAAKKAKRAGAFDSSLVYLEKGIDFLGDSGWTERYDLALLLYTEAAVGAYRSNDHEKMERFSQVVLDKARGILDKERVYELKILAYTNQNNHQSANEVGFEALGHLGMHFPKNPGKLRLRIEYWSIKRHISEKNVSALYKLPRMQDKYKIMAMRLLARLTMTFMVLSEPLHVLSAFKRFKITIKYGYSNEADSAFACLASVLCGTFDNIDAGYRLCKTVMSLSLNESAKNEILFYFNAMIRFRKEHIKNMLNPLLEAHQTFHQAGYVQIAGLSLMYHAYVFYMGRNLMDLEKEFALNSAVLTKMKFLVAIVHHQIYRQQIQNLMGISKNPSRLAGEIFNAEKMLPILKKAEARILMCIAYLHETIASYIFGDYRYAYESTQCAEKYIETESTSKESILYPLHIFYDSIARLALFLEMKRSEQKKILKKVARNQKKMKIWAQHAPMNFQHKLYIVEAELCRIRGRDEAIDYYDRAIEGALQNEYINDAALAYELAAKFLLGKGRKDIARAYMNDSIRYYTRWGAAGKVKNSKEGYQSLIQDAMRQPSQTEMSNDTTEGSVTMGTQTLDIATVIKTSQLLSSEIDLERLLTNIMRLSIENAGAQHGYLILENETDNKLYIEAAGKIDEAVEVLKSIPLEDSNSLSISIVNYVKKTGENIVLDDAAGDGRFINDPYIMANKPKSILCAPIRHKGTMSGIIYLENNLTTYAFNPERLELIKILSAQAAISIENARLVVKEKKNAVLQKEIEMAQIIQQSLLPKRLPDIKNARIAFKYAPMMGIGGDFISFHYTESKNHLGIFICDVSGHGVSAALTASMVSMALDFFWDANIDKPAMILREMRNQLKGKMGGNFFTACLCSLNLNNSTMTFSSAGHPPVIIARNDGTLEMVKSTGRLINEFFEPNLLETIVSLHKKDRLILYTDGITEARNPDQEMLGEDDAKFSNWIKKIVNRSSTPDILCEQIFTEVLAYSRSDILDDDFTIVAVEYMG